MGVDTHFFSDGNPTFEDAVSLVQQIVGDVKIGHYEDTDGRPHGTVLFDYKGESRQMWIFEQCKDLDEKTPRTLFNLGCWGSSVEIMTLIGESLGGWLDANDCDDDPEVYIEKRNALERIEPSNNHSLLIALTREMGYDAASKFMALAQRWEPQLIQYNFGREGTDSGNASTVK